MPVAAETRGAWARPGGLRSTEASRRGDLRHLAGTAHVRSHVTSDGRSRRAAPTRSGRRASAFSVKTPPDPLVVGSLGVAHREVRARDDFAVRGLRRALRAFGGASAFGAASRHPARPLLWARARPSVQGPPSAQSRASPTRPSKQAPPSQARQACPQGAASALGAGAGAASAEGAASALGDSALGAASTARRPRPWARAPPSRRAPRLDRAGTTISSAVRLCGPQRASARATCGPPGRAASPPSVARAEAGAPRAHALLRPLLGPGRGRGFGANRVCEGAARSYGRSRRSP
jgi:hypothetical protein